MLEEKFGEGEAQKSMKKLFLNLDFVYILLSKSLITLSNVKMDLVYWANSVSKKGIDAFKKILIEKVIILSLIIYPSC